MADYRDGQELIQAHLKREFDAITDEWEDIL